MSSQIKLPKNFLALLQSALPPHQIFTDPADCLVYSYDNGRHRGLAQAVVFPETTEHVSRIVAYCYEYGVPVTARGRGTGTPGGAVPVNGGIVLSLERMRRILHLDAQNRCIKVQAGVLNQTVQNAAQKAGFFWAPDPGSSAYCTVGGNIGYNAGGPRAVKYGATREHVLALTAVCGTGQVIHTGSYTTKGAAGYDLTRLLIGSEGTLAIVTEAVLKLTALSPVKHTFRVLYKNINAAVKAVMDIMAMPFLPCALEFLDDVCVKLIAESLMDENFSSAFPGACLLLIDLDVEDETKIQLFKQILHNKDLIDIHYADSAEERKLLWLSRKTLSQKLRTLSPKKISEDVVVPVSNVAVLLTGIKKISEKYALPIVNFGHAGNGNIHVNLLINESIKDSSIADQCLNELFDLVIKLNGALSGEHGIGLEKKPFMSKAISPETLQLMRNIKTVFDPRHILNPGKIFPERDFNKKFPP